MLLKNVYRTFSKFVVGMLDEITPQNQKAQKKLQQNIKMKTVLLNK